MTLLLLLRSHGESEIVEPPVLVWPLGTANYPSQRRTAVSSTSIKRFDLLPVLTATLLEGVGTAEEAAVDLTAATAVSFIMRPRGSTTTPVVDAPAEFVSKPDGTVRYIWQAGDTDTPGNYDAEWSVTYPGGVATWPSQSYDLVQVIADLDAE